MIYGIIYYIIFLILFLVFFWAIEDNTLNKFATKVVEVDGQQMLVPDFTALEGDPRFIKSIGSKLVCDALGRLTGQKVKINRSLENTRSIVSGNPLKVDCFDIDNGIAAGYKPYEFSVYEGKNKFNKDIIEFYNRLALDASMKDALAEKNVIYIDIPYTVDKCENINGKLKCSKYVDEKVRIKRIEKYLKGKLINKLS